MNMEPFDHDAYREAYSANKDFKEVDQQLQIQIHVHDVNVTIDYHL